jgi:hypothetical protein
MMQSRSHRRVYNIHFIPESVMLYGITLVAVLFLSEASFANSSVRSEWKWDIHKHSVRSK